MRKGFVTLLFLIGWLTCGLLPSLAFATMEGEHASSMPGMAMTAGDHHAMAMAPEPRKKQTSHMDCSNGACCPICVAITPTALPDRISIASPFHPEPGLAAFLKERRPGPPAPPPKFII